MRIALIQISDMHCLGYAQESKSDRIDNAIAAIKALGHLDHAVLFCSGDLTDHAHSNEYKSAQRALGRFLTNLGAALNQFIPLIVVPGNHDIPFPPPIVVLPKSNVGSKMTTSVKNFKECQVFLTMLTAKNAF